MASGSGVSFSSVAAAIAKAAGRPIAFILALALSVLWLASGPYFQWSDGWNFAANSSTTVLTFLMVFLLQNSQNRDTLAVQAKLDELIHAVGGARDELERAEELDEEEIEVKRVGPARP